jgi:hypothetical protein
LNVLTGALPLLLFPDEEGAGVFVDGVFSNVLAGALLLLLLLLLSLL